VDWQGKSVTGGEIDYNGSPTGYTLDPQENVLYVSAHDNETLFDAIQVKAPLDASLAERVRMHNLGISLVMLGQGVPFFQAGDDLLRSKSLDRNSFNSGDWFNRLDFSGEMNNFGIGLPPAADNAAYWPEMVRLLANPALKPGKAEMRQAAEHFCEMLRIRRSSLLFRLRNAEQVRARLSFGANLPGVIVMRLRDLPQERLDQNYAQIQVVFNARSQAVEIEAEAGEHPCLPFRLHPLQAQSYDPVERIARYDLERGIFSVPGRTTAVFVRSWE
jgi:pullulanase/glycogen debranching enzyme